MEIEPRVIVVGSGELLESFDLLLPISFTITTSIRGLISKIDRLAKERAANLQRFFVLFLESISNEDDEIYRKLEDNAQVIVLFHIGNKPASSMITLTKACYISYQLITSAVSMSIIECLKSEAEQQHLANCNTLARIYLRQADKLKEWLMVHVRVCEHMTWSSRIAHYKVTARRNRVIFLSYLSTRNKQMLLTWLKNSDKAVSTIVDSCRWAQMGRVFFYVRWKFGLPVN